ncbi:hypothetical protein D3C85_1298070 [compost metagenome]
MKLLALINLYPYEPLFNVRYEKKTALFVLNSQRKPANKPTASAPVKAAVFLKILFPLALPIPKTTAPLVGSFSLLNETLNKRLVTALAFEIS